MRWGIHHYAAVLLWINLLAPLSQAQRLCPAFQSNDYEGSSQVTGSTYDYPDSCTNYTIKYFSDERIEIFWDVKEKIPDMNVTMFYKFDGQDLKQCPQYVLHQGYNTACIFQTEGDFFHISIWDANGTTKLYFSENDEDKHIFFKPNPPENATFQWADDEVTIKYNPPRFQHCLTLELQHKKKFDQDWQHRKSSGLEIKTRGFDPMICYSFRFRLEFTCGVPFSSEWGAESLWKNGSSVDSCANDDSRLKSNTVILLTVVMAGLLIIFILLLCVCRLKRIRKILLPVVPDPKNIYSELYRDHNGNFQEWINKTGNVLVQKTLECVEEECIIEEEE